MKILAIVDTDTGTPTPLAATVEPARAGCLLVTLPGIGWVLVTPQGRIVRAYRVRLPLQEVADA